MPHVTFVYPCIGRFPSTRYVRSWQMQPLAIGALSAQTPPEWGRRFFDDRLELIDYDAPTDLAAISIETYTAKRGYEIAAEYRQRGVPVVMGGYHATFRPDEVLEHADAVCVGEAEGVWPRILADAAADRMAGAYRADAPPSLEGLRVDRTIYGGKNYFKLAMVETGRGCPHACRFCSITAFHERRYRRRPVEEVVDEVRALPEKSVFFVDDNVVADRRRAMALCRALEPIGIRWIGQGSIDAARDPELLAAMARSGCLGLLVGLESLESGTLARMGKRVNRSVDYDAALDAFRRHGILIYGTFVFGYPGDTPELVRRSVRFAVRHRMYLAAFNHLVPFPGTPLYDELLRDGRFAEPRWWLDDAFRFGQVPFEPRDNSAHEIERLCHAARRTFYGWPAIFRRGMDPVSNCADWKRARTFLLLNALLQREVRQKRGLPLGLREADDG